MAILTRKHRKGQYDSSWYSQDGSIEVRPAYGPSIRGGSVTRPSHWVVISTEGTREAGSVATARVFVTGILTKRNAIKEN